MSRFSISGLCLIAGLLTVAVTPSAGAVDLFVDPVVAIAADGDCSLIEAFVNAENDDPLDACPSRPRVYRSAH